jgi:hypothetical protein
VHHVVLYLTPAGDSAVVAGDYVCSPWKRGHQRSGAPLDHPDAPEVVSNLVFVAPVVEAFLYRWWVENAIWHKLADPQSTSTTRRRSPAKRLRTWSSTDGTRRPVT